MAFAVTISQSSLFLPSSSKKHQMSEYLLGKLCVIPSFDFQRLVKSMPLSVAVNPYNQRWVTQSAIEVFQFKAYFLVV